MRAKSKGAPRARIIFGHASGPGQHFHAVHIGSFMITAARITPSTTHVQS